MNFSMNCAVCLSVYLWLNLIVIVLVVLLIHLRLYYFLFQIALGTVTNVEEGVRWLQYTYLYVRLRCNPLVYGITYSTLEVCMIKLNFYEYSSKNSVFNLKRNFSSGF